VPGVAILRQGDVAPALTLRPGGALEAEAAMLELTVKDRRVKVSRRVIVGAVTAVLALVFIFQNTTDTRVHILFWRIDRPAWLLFLVLFAAGFVVGSLLPWFRRRSKDDRSTPRPSE
jgi:uncharacterized integral membrane protein